MRTLLVEDDPNTRFMMREILEEMGIPFDEACDGQEFLSMIAEAPSAYSLILMDIHMPKLSGLDAVKKLRSADTHPPRDIRTIAVTADSHWHNQDRVRAAGFDNVLPKPVRLGELRALYEAA